MNPEFLGDFELSFMNYDNNPNSVKLKFDIKQLWSFSRDTTSVAFDFLILAFIVYNVDRALNRQKYSVDGWRRQIKLCNVPVNHLDSMNKGREVFNRAISFLTGDNWNINFVQGQGYDYNPTRKVMDYDYQDYEKVALFSGGLDSLIGFIDEASTLSAGKKVLLISHKELGKEGHDQDNILDYCMNNRIFEGKYDRLLLNAGLRSRTWQISGSPAEATFRSRSLLFFAAGIYSAYHIGEQVNLIVPENGTISINIPLDKGRRSACSTRTTHPTFIKKLEEALLLIGINNKFENPYKYLSKADMMNNCYEDNSKRDILINLANLSCSCAKRGHNHYWDKESEIIKQTHINHCGMCLPCLYRRVSLDAVGLDNTDLIGTDVFHGVKYNLSNREQKSTRDFKALLFFLKNRFNEHIIRRELLMNGITDSDELNNYVRLGMHSYEQVKDWIATRAPHEIKQMAGIE